MPLGKKRKGGSQVWWSRKLLQERLLFVSTTGNWKDFTGQLPSPGVSISCCLSFGTFCAQCACVALNTLADIASPQTNWCTLCARVQAGPLCCKDIWHIFPNKKAKVLWLNILGLEITASRGPNSFAGKGNESIGCVQLGRLRRSGVFVFVAVFFPLFVESRLNT